MYSECSDITDYTKCWRLTKHSALREEMCSEEWERISLDKFGSDSENMLRFVVVFCFIFSIISGSSALFLCNNGDHMRVFYICLFICVVFFLSTSSFNFVVVAIERQMYRFFVRALFSFSLKLKITKSSFSLWFARFFFGVVFDQTINLFGFIVCMCESWLFFTGGEKRNTNAAIQKKKSLATLLVTYGTNDFESWNRCCCFLMQHIECRIRRLRWKEREKTKLFFCFLSGAEKYESAKWRKAETKLVWESFQNSLSAAMVVTGNDRLFKIDAVVYF